MAITITLDTNVFKRYKDQLKSLEKEGKIQLFGNEFLDDEFNKNSIEMKNPRVGAVGHIRVGENMEDQNAVLQSKLLKICFPNFENDLKSNSNDPKSKKSNDDFHKNRKADVNMLIGHINGKRDYFLTLNTKDFIKNGKRETLKEVYGIKVITFDDLLELLK